ncbi:hypothetical protein [Herbaspirillum seropedicae]|uniref:hypothetical protein n=1 Tax=Herbaspirillum seropedicae TaxID=964 RepID=UPI003FCE33E3
MTHPTGWPTAQSICDIPEVHEALDAFSHDSTEDNAVGLICAVLNHSPASVRAAALDIDAAAKQLAESLDYPWEYMPEEGRNSMRAVINTALSAAPAGGLGDMDVESLIPDGWLLSSVDASMKAHGKSGTISVMLVKDKAGRDAYHALSDEEKESATLYWCAHGYTIRDAITIAAQAIAAAQGEGK